MNKVLLNVNISISNDGLTKLDTVLNQLQKVGLKVQGIFEEVGVITGNIAPEAISKLQEVEEVTAVEIGRKYTALDSDERNDNG